MTPYDPRAAALDALAAMRFPDVSEPPAEHVEAVEKYLWAEYAFARVALAGAPVGEAAANAVVAALMGRPITPPDAPA